MAFSRTGAVHTRAQRCRPPLRANPTVICRRNRDSEDSFMRWAGRGRHKDGSLWFEAFEVPFARPCGAHRAVFAQQLSLSRTGNCATASLRAGSAPVFRKTTRGVRHKSVNNIMYAVVGRVRAGIGRGSCPCRASSASFARRTRDYPRGSSCGGLHHGACRARRISLLARNPAACRRTAPLSFCAGSGPGRAQLERLLRQPQILGIRTQHAGGFR
jgi:hypothetical protein